MYLEKLTSQAVQRFNKKEYHDLDFRAFSLFERKINTILDIGANVGQSIVSFRICFPEAEIVSFEANPTLIPELEKVAQIIPGLIKICPYGLSDEEGTHILHIPYAGDEPFIEEASVSLDYYELPWVKQKFIDRGGLTKLAEVPCMLKIGDRENLSPDIVKVDVEGFEASVLRGLRKTIEKAQPIFMVENSDWHSVTSFMNVLGYTPFRYEQKQHVLVPFYGATTNAFYLSKIDALSVPR